jgi:1,2-diacylglycerol-3-alpha-glucose alpha-1,2-galactosyltransferase
MDPILTLEIVAEKRFIRKANGVHTAVVQLVEQLRKRDDIKISVNTSSSQVDVIHAHTLGAHYLLKALTCRDHLVASAHVVPESFLGSLIFDKFCYGVAKFYLKFALNRARLVIAVSPVVKTQLKRLGVTTEIVVLCNSVDRQQFRPDKQLRKRVRTQLGLSDDGFISLCVGQIQRRKGIQTFLNVAEILPQMTFVWVGGRPFGRLTANYDEMTELMEQAPQNVRFIDAVDFEEMPGYYAMADVFFFPSFQENFAYAILEASSTRLPLVLRDNPEYPYLLFTHYLKAGTDEGFAETLRHLTKDVSFLETWQQESDTLASKYEIHKYVEQLVTCYKYIARSRLN